MTDVVDAFRRLAELVADPALDVYKNASIETLSSGARAVLIERCGALREHMWRLIGEKYGIRRAEPFCVVFHTNRHCAVCVTRRPDVAMAAATRWVGSTKPCIAVVGFDRAFVFVRIENPDDVAEVMGPPEHWLTLAASLTWERPAWLTVVQQPPPPPRPEPMVVVNFTSQTEAGEIAGP